MVDESGFWSQGRGQMNENARRDNQQNQKYPLCDQPILFNGECQAGTSYHHTNHSCLMHCDRYRFLVQNSLQKTICCHIVVVFKGELMLHIKVCFQVLGSTTAYVKQLYLNFSISRGHCVKFDKCLQVMTLDMSSPSLCTSHLIFTAGQRLHGTLFTTSITAKTTRLVAELRVLKQKNTSWNRNIQYLCF